MRNRWGGLIARLARTDRSAGPGMASLRVLAVAAPVKQQQRRQFQTAPIFFANTSPPSTFERTGPTDLASKSDTAVAEGEDEADLPPDESDEWIEVGPDDKWTDEAELSSEGDAAELVESATAAAAAAEAAASTAASSPRRRKINKNKIPPRPKVDEADITEKFLRGSGPGGQKINKTSSAVQIKHIPTGIVVKSQATRSRSQNRTIARRILAERLDLAARGADSRVEMRRELKKRRKADRAKKAKRKYRALDQAKAERMALEGEGKGQDGQGTGGTVGSG